MGIRNRKSSSSNTVRNVERIAKKRPSIFRKIRNWGAIGVLAGGIGAAQGPAVKGHYEATRASMKRGAEITQVANQTTSQRVRNMLNRQQTQPKIIVGKRMLSGPDEKGNQHIGKVDVAAQAAKSYRPTLNMNPQTARKAGKGALYGGGTGGIFGIFSFFRSRKKYKKKMRDAIE